MADTIAAIAGGAGRSAIGIVRLSGDGAIDIADRAFRPLKGGPLALRPSRKLVLGDAVAEDGRVMDRCLAVISRGPDSYTGEDTAEFQCHGSPTLLAALLRRLFALGARQALPGEYTKRAFLNGRLDLTQAEAVVDLIDAETEQSLFSAAAQLGGAVSRRTDAVYRSLAEASAHFHAVIDYPDDETEPFENVRLREVLSSAEAELERLVKSFDRGRILREGVPCALLGRPNAGKSSLLNALLGYDRAIVTAEEGTTRDVIEEKLVLGGVLLRLKDTAGLRGAAGEAEKQGIERALEAAGSSRLVIAVFDGSRPFSREDEAVAAAAAKAEKSVAVVNKLDLGASELPEALFSGFGAVIRASALTGEGLDRLEEHISGLFTAGDEADGELITNARHRDAIARAVSALRRAREALDRGMTPDAVLTDSEEAMAALGELSGRTVKEDIINTVFSRFCVGK
ncbi:MAG: tRNA uridine-5-carboxymethylaminomethyl(34) synthesis GTPase MnmE [Oscillospiraceae bacterium]|jgi:tRNA modification GTPase|nr:tRNA uridine-5-carboxymethylaminomethyl(34) synthesis GTPase MnmE [Oscillospiraceae bacterium]